MYLQTLLVVLIRESEQFISPIGQAWKDCSCTLFLSSFYPIEFSWSKVLMRQHVYCKIAYVINMDKIWTLLKSIKIDLCKMIKVTTSWKCICQIFFWYMYRIVSFIIWIYMWEYCNIIKIQEINNICYFFKLFWINCNS